MQQNLSVKLKDYSRVQTFSLVERLKATEDLNL